jgi:hypothetical protein
MSNGQGKNPDDCREEVVNNVTSAEPGAQSAVGASSEGMNYHSSGIIMNFIVFAYSCSCFAS